MLVVTKCRQTKALNIATDTESLILPVYSTLLTSGYDLFHAAVWSAYIQTQTPETEPQVAYIHT